MAGKNIGKLNSEEKHAIEAWCLEEGMTDAQIAERLGRNVETVVRARKKMGISKTNSGHTKLDPNRKSLTPSLKEGGTRKDQEKYWRNTFRISPRAARVKELLTEENYEQFVEQWVQYHLQLEDMNQSEEDTLELMLHQKIRIEENQRGFKEAQIVEKQLRNSMVGKEELDLENEKDRQTWEMIQSNDRKKQELNKDLKDLNERYEKLQRSLNVTREQREAKKTIGADTFLSLIFACNERDKRMEMGKYAERMRIATEHQTTKLKKAHQYEDGTVEPLLLDGNDFLDKEAPEDVPKQ